MKIYEKKIRICYPFRNQEEYRTDLQVKRFISKLLHTENEDIYYTVERFEREVLPRISPKKLPPKDIRKREKARLVDLINLHNAGGIKCLEQIRGMLDSLKERKELISETGLPNVKTVVARNGKIVLFDGHHSCIAYIISGRKLLGSIPHLTISNEQDDSVKDEELFTFFGPHAKKLTTDNWQNYVINWQASENLQLEERKQNDMGELVESLSCSF